MDRFIVRGTSAASNVSHDNSKKRSAETESTNPGTPKRQKYSDKDYDKNKRVRTFQSGWKVTFPWVKYMQDSDEEKPGIMFCTTCREYPDIADKSSALYIGCNNMRLDPLKKHDTSVAHIKASEKKKLQSMSSKERSTMSQNSPLVRASKNSAKINMNILTVMFNTVYALAKKGKPLSDYETRMEIHAKNHLDIGNDYINIGSNYLTEKSAKQFLMTIAKDLHEKTKQSLMSARFVTVLADGSTDSSITEQYTVLLRFVLSGCPVTKVASIEAVESGNAEGILKGIETALEKVCVGDADGPKLVCANIDGATVMMGCKSGVSTLLSKKHPYMLSIHCVAHKLELGVLDAVKEIDHLAKFEATVKGIYRFYAMSPKRRRELEGIAAMLETDLLRYGEVKTVRWVASKGKALRAISNNLVATIGHLEHAASSSRSEESGKAKKLLQEVQSSRFVKYLHLMMDFLSAITATSTKFQKCDLLIMEVPEVIKNLTDELEIMKVEPSEFTQKFYNNYNSENGVFTAGDHEVKLTGLKQTSYEVDKDKDRLLNSTIEYVNKRFSNFQEKPLNLLSVFNIKMWPDSEKELLMYGRKEIKELCEHFGEILNDEEKGEMTREWTVLKNRIKCRRSSSLYNIYTELLQSKPDDIPHILTLIDLMMTISPSTAECERQFSAMKLIKSARRSHMNQDTLEALMRVHSDGPPITSYNPNPAIYRWMDEGPGTRHIGGHKIPDRKVVEVSDTEEDSARDQ